MSGITIDDLKVRNEMRDSVMELIGKIIEKQLNGILEGVKEIVLEKDAEINRLTALVEKQWQPITSIDQLESGRWYWYRREHPSWKSRFEAVRCTLPSGRKRLGPWWATQDNNQAIGDFAECYGPIQPPTQQEGE